MSDQQNIYAAIAQAIVDAENGGDPRVLEMLAKNLEPQARSPMFNPNQMDPMTATQMESSRRSVADARFQQQAPGVAQGAFELTGIPMMYRGGNDIASGYSDGNPMQMARGAAGAAVGAMPWTRAGRALFASAPVTTTAGAVTLPNLDISMPGAQAAQQGLPPIPVQRDAQPQAMPEAQAPQPGMGQTFFDQLRNNASQAASGIYEGARGAFNEMSQGLMGTSGFQAEPFDEWAKKNAGIDLAAAQQAEAASRADIPGVNARTANDIRKREAEKAEQIRTKVQSTYEQYVSDGQKAFADDLNTKTFAQRNPSLNAALTFGPALLAGGRYAAKVGGINRDIARRTADINKSGNRTTQAKRDELAALLDKKPGPKDALPYMGQAFAGSALAKAGTDFYDATSLPADSEARSRVRQSYIPFDDEGTFAPKPMLEMLGNYAIRGAASAAAPAAMSLMSRGLPESVKQSAMTAAGIPNVAANRLRITSQRELDALKNQDLIERQKFPQVSPPGGPQPTQPGGGLMPQPASQPVGPARPSAPGTGPTGPVGGPGPNQPQTPGSRPGSNQGTSGRPQGKSTALSTPEKKSLEDRFIANQGKLTAKDWQDLAPNASQKVRDNFIEKQNDLMDRARKVKGVADPMDVLRNYQGKFKSVAPIVGAGAAAYNVPAMLREETDY